MKKNFRFYIPSLREAGLAKTSGYARFYQRYVKIERSDVVLDVGSCLGSFAVPASRIVGEKGLVVCIEPAPENLYFLKKNVCRLNNVLILEKCVSNCEGECALYLSPNIRSHSITYPTDTIMKVSTDTLDNIIRKLELQKVDFIKINAEGAEIEVLEGAPKVLSMTHKVVVEAHHKRNGRETCFSVKQLLEKHGFRVLVALDKTVHAWKFDSSAS